MEFRNRIASVLGAVVAVAMLVGAIAVYTQRTSSPAPGASTADTASGDVATAPPLPASLPRMASFQDQLVKVSLGDAPTADKAQSKLWFAHGSWWGAMLEPVSGEVHVYRLAWDTQRWTDTGVVIDERPFSHADVLWSGDHLYIASAGRSPFQSHAARFIRMSFDDAAGKWSIDQGFPVQLNDRGVTSIVLTRAQDGIVWIAYIESKVVSVVHSSTDELTWSKPTTPGPIDGGATRVALGTVGDGVDLLWSDTENNAVGLTRHEDGDPAGTWSDAETIVEGALSSDDHLNIKVATVDGEERLYLAVKTSLDESPEANPNSPQVSLIEIRPDGRVATHLVGRIRDHHTRPLVLVDEEHQMIYVVATSPFGGGRIYYKRSPLSAIAFPVGRGTALVRSDADLLLNDATSTKQNLTAASGLVVLAWASDTNRYVHGVVDLGGTQWSAQSRLGKPAPGTSPEPEPDASSLTESPAASPGATAEPPAASPAAPSSSP
jgi:hypothetical protein